MQSENGIHNSLAGELQNSNKSKRGERTLRRSTWQHFADTDDSGRPGKVPDGRASSTDRVESADLDHSSEQLDQ
ncbi:unnamed protein product [Strongylus vulgaris]|uniref:Uncharacterized protein n=1 Tax=Strongylus vulgaris TaxID=40348 RepID=A0A3P7JMX5_STRVU|nr:unnamed protein product [Strongylus vulgaris]